jgi:tRNA threonylcarbamoyladenosine biosynthesis protein TsaB
MLVLALDTTTKGGSCAVARDGAVVGERAGDATRAHDTRLPSDLITLLEETGIALSAIETFAVATGPGSFTGLRIGIATMQGLAFAGGKPLLGVSAFDALARAAADASGPVATWIDAWRGDVHAALYKGGVALEAPTVAAPTALLGRLRGTRTRFIGDAAGIYRDVILEALGADADMADPVAPLLAGTIARVATELADAGHRPPPGSIRPLYVRRVDAELARDPRPVG